MPIRFRCDNCNQKLSVSSQKVGARAKCPKCQKSLTIPSAPEMGEESVADAGEPDVTAIDPFAEFVVYDEEAANPRHTPKPFSAVESENPQIDYNRISIHRRVIYLQGALLGIVALSFFAFGLFVGSNASNREIAEAQPPQACTISGRVAFRGLDNELLPDAGAVVMALPKQLRPENQNEVDGLRPTDPIPEQNHPVIFSLRALGGDYARADQNGDFKVNVSDVGEYFFLFLSKTKQRTSEKLNSRHLQQMGRYFIPVPDLLGESSYAWTEVQIRRDMTLTHVFP
ncbi:MAG: zinc-ribbon domain-containing protein [Pirellulaceae bacterium]|nr:zinc-ribbon domain-containing protein [Pirellulaceae bacterium]